MVRHWRTSSPRAWAPSRTNSSGQRAAGPLQRQRRQRPPAGAEQLGAGLVAGAQAQEVRRVGALAGQQLGDEGVLVGRGQQPAAALAADGGGPLVPGGGPAERARPRGGGNGQPL